MISRRFITILVALGIAAAWAATGAAGDGGPSPGVSSGRDGVAAPGGKVRYVAMAGGRGTVVAVVRVRGGRVVRYGWIPGSYGVPLVAYDGSAGGLTRDGKRLVLASWIGAPGPQAVSRFALVTTKTLRLRRVVTLRGAFSFDALSPDGSTLYLIQYLSTQNGARYLVRAYDLEAGRLLRRVIFDRREGPGAMSGQPVTRATSADGGWVYTLYARQGDAPFIHALDARHRKAVCIDLRWRGSQDGLWKVRLALSPDEKRIVLMRRGGGRIAAIDAPGR